MSVCAQTLFSLKELSIPSSLAGDMAPYMYVPLSLLRAPLNKPFQTPTIMQPILTFWLSKFFHTPKLWELYQQAKAPFQVSTATPWKHIPEVSQ